MNSLLAHALIVGIPLLLTAVLALGIYRHKGPHPATYTMSDPWTHGPILWSATDVVFDGGHAHGHGAAFSVGGGASGKW